MEFIGDYFLFFAKLITSIIALMLVLVGTLSLLTKFSSRSREELEVVCLNERLQDFKDILNQEILPRKDYKEWAKQEKKSKEKKAEVLAQQRKLFVLQFDGDINASRAKALREEVTAVLAAAAAQDQVLVKIESPGGMVSGYGLAASQLARIRHHGLHLIVAVDKIAASGGYMMAVVANHIMAAPFAVIGSIGVVGQLPNFHRFLKKHDVDYEMHMAGEFKRTLSLFAENTDKARQKFKDELEQVHSLFKAFIQDYRPQLNMAEIATGEYWYGQHALSLGLIDSIGTSDDYIMQQVEQCAVYAIIYKTKPTLWQKLSSHVSRLKSFIAENQYISVL